MLKRNFVKIPNLSNFRNSGKTAVDLGLLILDTKLDKITACTKRGYLEDLGKRWIQNYGPRYTLHCSHVFLLLLATVGMSQDTDTHFKDDCGPISQEE